MRTREHDLVAVAAAALTWNRARLVRIALAKRMPPWPHPQHLHAEAALKQARQNEARAKASLRKACMKADPATVTIDAEPLPTLKLEG